MTIRLTGALSTLTCAVVLCAAAPTKAQEKVGVVTTVIGPVTVARAALPPEPLKFKDGVFVRDRVTTGENAITRILLGGKVVITARERTSLTITETPGLSTIDLSTGRIAVAVEKGLMKPGERLDIRTPNAVAGVRGTVLFVEAAEDRSTITVTRGLVHVTRLDSVTGVPVGPFTAVGARQTVTVSNDVLPTRAAPISRSRSRELSDEFTPPLRGVMPAAVLHHADEISRLLDRSEARAPGAAIDRTAPVVPTAASASAAAPVLVSTPAPTLVTTPMAAPALVSPPVPALVPTAVAPPVLVSAPVPTLVTTPVAVPSIKTSSPNYGASFMHSASKGAKEDRSGSNRGRN